MTSKNYLSIYAKSFNWAGFFLPKETYKKCSALYDFCRVIDNIADEKNQIKIKQNKFEEFKNNFNKKNFDDSIIENMWKLINEFNISLKIIDDLFDGIESDIKDEVKLNSKKDLLVYSYRVAGTVGLMMAKILNVNKKNSLKSAIDLGIAMQLTNISRDEFSETVGYRISGPNKSFIYIPDIDKWNKWDKNLQEIVAQNDYLFLDGTFAEQNELPGRNMSEIPHPFIVETMELLKDVKNKSKIYFIHLNHTNTALMPNSQISFEMKELGFRIAKYKEKFKL